MKDISQIDKNFFVNTEFDTSGLRVYNALENPFRIYGLICPEHETDRFQRIPEEIAKNANPGVFALYCNTSGGRVRFRTNSSKIAIFARMDRIAKMPHFALTGSAGFDLYIDNRYEKTFIPPYDIKDGYSSLITLDNDREKDVTIYFPLYSDVLSLAIGLADNASLSAPKEYRYDKPIVYYGSSITQGGCASRAGNSYQGMISRRLDCDYINLGFSGYARGERILAEYIGGLAMKAFVYDYDHNAPTLEHLEKTHQPMFEVIREKNPELPIIMLSRPKIYPDDDTVKRLQVIEKTYRDAVSGGDKNVYLINGSEMMRTLADDGATVDACHPNDYGFVAMAKRIGDVLEEILR